MLAKPADAVGERLARVPGAQAFLAVWSDRAVLAFRGTKLEARRPLPPALSGTKSFVERFFKTFQEEFVELAFLQKLYTSVEMLQEDVDAWLRFYNYERPHRGYRNMGRRPIDTIQQFLQPVRQEA